MTDPAQQLAQDRDRRKRARGAFDANLAQVKDDLAARGVAGRIADQAEAEVRGAIAQGVDVARESKGIIAATLAALGLWFFRVPLIALARRHLFKAADPAPVQED
jgi:hypothetical protein